MAYPLVKKTLNIITFYLMLSSSYLFRLSNGLFSEEVSEGISMKRMEKTTHLHFFFHDFNSGENPTVFQIAGTSDPSSWFGNMYIVDDPLREGQDESSKLVGRAQGIGAFASQNGIACLIVQNFVFTEGEFNGSTISVFGRNPYNDDVREMPIVGGTGRFRYASGYALLHTVWEDDIGNAIVEYNVYIKHY